MNTTISIPTDMRDEIKDLGKKGETYEEILRRIIDNAKDNMLQELLMDEDDSITIEEARKQNG